MPTLRPASVLRQVVLPVALGATLAAATAMAVGPAPAVQPDWAVQAREIRRQQAAAVGQWAAVQGQAGVYQAPVDLMIERVAANPDLLRSVPMVLTTPSSPEEAGRQIFTKIQPCSTCHAIEPSDMAVKLGPRLHGRFGGVAKFQGGETTFDEAYVTESIKNPHAKIAEGFPPVMPPMPITDQQVSDLVAFLKSLR